MNQKSGRPLEAQIKIFVFTDARVKISIITDGMELSGTSVFKILFNDISLNKV